MYLVLELVLGGELFTLLDTEDVPESSARFYAACVLSGLGHLHERRILYRDLKVRCIALHYSSLHGMLCMMCVTTVPSAHSLPIPFPTA